MDCRVSPEMPVPPGLPDWAALRVSQVPLGARVCKESRGESGHREEPGRLEMSDLWAVWGVRVCQGRLARKAGAAA